VKPGFDDSLRLAIVALAASLACQAGLAQTRPANAPNAGTVLETAPQPPIPRATDVAPVDASRAQPAAQPVAAGPKVKVKSFRLSGNTVISAEQLAATLRPFENRELSMQELSDAADAVRDRYRDAGYFLAQALLPTQDVTDGVVNIRIVEGTVGQARADVAPEARVPASLVNGYLGLLPSGALVTEQSVERPLLLLSDLPSVKVHSVLKPGSQFGTADLDLKVTQEGRLFGGSVYADNYGNRNTGETRLGADLETRGLLGLGELLTVSLFRASNLTTLGRLGATLPVGPLGTKVSLSYTQLSYDVAGAFSNLNADGEGKIVSLLAQHPWTRSRNANLFLLAGVDVKKIEDRTAGTGSGSSSAAANIDGRNINLLRLGVNGDFRDDLGGGALNSYSLSLFQGQNKIQTADTLLVDQRSTQTNGSFTKVQFEFLRLQSLASFLSEADSLALAIKGQLASKNLDASEKVSLGGPRGVRAFPVGAASGDDALLLSAELRHRLAGFRPFGANVVLSAFVDYGTVKVLHRGTSADNKLTLGAAGIGLNVVKKDDFQVRLEVASRLGGNDYTGDEADTKTRGWLLAQKWF
jgi:hemolysin activation/secretion protein